MFHYQIKIHNRKQAILCYNYNNDENYYDYPIFFKPKENSNKVFCVIHGTTDGCINNVGLPLTVEEFYNQNRTLLEMLKCKKLYIISCMGGRQKENWILVDGVEIKNIITSTEDIKVRFNLNTFGGNCEILTDTEIDKIPYVKLLRT